MNPRVAMLAVVTAAALLLTGCSTTTARPSASPSPQASHSATAPEPVAPPSIGAAATATGPQVQVHDAAGGAVTSTLANPQPSGAPLTFLVVKPGNGWMQVMLPGRPNGSTGWIESSAVSLTLLQYHLRVSIADKTLTLYKNDDVVKTYPVATGTGGTPTPLGSFYLTELIKPTNAGYGPYAFGLSAHSEVLNSFGGGPGQIGLHGTEDAASIGRAASHGCIRLSNDDITALAQILPLGTPITIE
jgi:lipoprotein-anchoring transpeptidase ErfK/SrfK